MSAMACLRQLSALVRWWGTIVARHWKMGDPLGWPMWLQILLLVVLIAGAALEWFVTGYSGLLVIAFGLIVAVYLRRRYSN